MTEAPTCGGTIPCAVKVGDEVRFSETGPDAARNNMRRHTGLRPVEPFACTGSAHLAGEHIRCTSPAHDNAPEYDQQSGWTCA